MTTQTEIKPVQMLPDGRMDPENAANYLGMSVHTLAKWRSAGEGPRYIKPGGGKIFYYQEDLDQWLNRESSTSV